MRTAGRIVPCTVTRPTPLISDSFGCNIVSAASDIVSTGRVSEVSANVRIGASARVYLWSTSATWVQTRRQGRRPR